MYLGLNPIFEQVKGGQNKKLLNQSKHLEDLRTEDFLQLQTINGQSKNKVTWLTEQIGTSEENKNTKSMK